MEEIDQISDFNIEDDYFRCCHQDSEDEEQKLEEAPKQPRVQLGFTEEDISDDEENGCALQSQLYQLNYVSSGPVVKVY